MSSGGAAGVGSLVETADVDPGPYYRRVREAGNLVWDEQMNAWVATSYELVREITRQDNILWRSPLVPDDHPPLGLTWERWEEFLGSRYRLFSLEGPTHRRMHRWWLQVFKEDVLRGWSKEIIAPIAHQAIDRFAGAGRAELGSAYGDWVAPRIILAIMGITDADDDSIGRLFACAQRQDAALEHNAGVAPDDVMASGIAAVYEMYDMFMPYIEARRSGTGNDFISLLWRGAEELFGGEDFDERDVANQCIQAFMAGSDTTSSVVANGVYLLLTDPVLQEHIRAGGSAAARTFVEETLRLYGPVTFRPRIAKEDVELAGQLIKRGEMVIAHSSAAGRDPARYDRPEEVSLDLLDAFDHFAFFRGPRQCPGRPLARIELEVLFSVLLERLQSLRLDPAAEPPRYIELMLRQWRPLHALFDVPGASR
jgi:cytochrome P450